MRKVAWVAVGLLLSGSALSVVGGTKEQGLNDRAAHIRAPMEAASWAMQRGVTLPELQALLSTVHSRW